MSEVKNEGLEVVAVIEIGDPDHETGACDSLEIIPHEVEFIDGEKLCRHSEALAGYAVRDARIAELEEEVKTSAECLDMANELYETHKDKTDQLRAELADAKETISRYEVTADNCDVLRAELATPAPIPDSDHSEDVRAMVVPDGYALVSLESIGQFPEINPANYGDDEVIALNNWAIDLVLAASPSAKDASQ